eukprot:TRINITY_DN8386_c0_g1_i2.p1 TRINITY_DN8386_c0_g1~~TRINITY_DN8386_c0_g1_i2.p1  ORF type:complete len:110 (-),score=26.87 TRINITY_DN8386_c0_g1_i2:2-331(-)
MSQTKDMNLPSLHSPLKTFDEILEDFLEEERKRKLNPQSLILSPHNIASSTITKKRGRPRKETVGQGLKEGAKSPIIDFIPSQHRVFNYHQEERKAKKRDCWSRIKRRS